MRPNFLYILVLFVLVNSCDTGGGGGGELDPETPELKILEPSLLSETGFQLNWSVINPVGFNTIEVLLWEDEEMTKIIRVVELNDISAQKTTFDGLKGATTYFYRVSLKNQGSGVVESDLKRVETSFRMDSFSLLTEDSYELTAKLAYLESVSGSRPGIIMMHEFGVWVNPWVGSALLKQLVAEGYVCLTFFKQGAWHFHTYGRYYGPDK